MGAPQHWWQRWIERLGRRRAPGRRQSLDSIVHAFEQHIDIHFGNPALLQRALTHRSYLGGEEAHGPDSNERLEFLGDAVLELIVIESLYQRHPQAREGDLTKKKSLLVSRSVLADCAETLGLGRYILLSDAERGSGGGERSSILADAFEAVLGAIYIDQGLPAAQGFVTRWLLSRSEEILQDDENQNFKSILQESIQARLRIHPRYRITSEEGPDHEKRFTVSVLVRGEVLGTGRGHNKKVAEQQAAREALGSGALERWLQRLDDAGPEADRFEIDS